MCLAVPGKILRIKDNGRADVEIGGVVREAGLELVPGVKVGDYVLIHTGYAIQIVDEKEAKETWDLLQELADSQELADG